jgi:hypothetical protein
MTIPVLKSAVEATFAPFKIFDPSQGIIYIPALLLATKKAQFISRRTNFFAGSIRSATQVRQTCHIGRHANTLVGMGIKCVIMAGGKDLACFWHDRGCKLKSGRNKKVKKAALKGRIKKEVCYVTGQTQLPHKRCQPFLQQSAG